MSIKEKIFISKINQPYKIKNKDQKILLLKKYLNE